jgi:predicted dehydrogenase
MPLQATSYRSGKDLIMTRYNRRQFLRQTQYAGLGAAAWTILRDPRSLRAAPANERIVLAAVGCGGRGKSLIQGFLNRDDCRYAYACDPNGFQAESAAKLIEERQGSGPKVASDFREALEDPAVDAIISATPDHWHALSSVWACQAGKDVYVEKPPTHNCWEGQQMLAAARQHDRVVQCGFQNRSAPYNLAAT